MSPASRSIRSAWLQAFLRHGIDDRADVGREQPWVADRQFGDRARRKSACHGPAVQTSHLEHSSPRTFSGD
jgi:hypothetical protein